VVPTSRVKIFETALLVAFAISADLAIQAWAVKPFEIPSGSMEPTLAPGQRVLVDRISGNLGSDPEVGEVVVFHPPLAAVPEEASGDEAIPECGVPNPIALERVCPAPGERRADQYFIKRVVAGPGDRLRILDGVPIVDGTRLDESWETVSCKGRECDFPKPVTVPADHYFMMGDNRPSSDDSRFWGPVPREWIIGTAFATYWPPKRVGGL
jgi:signal peptidase I